MATEPNTAPADVIAATNELIKEVRDWIYITASELSITRVIQETRDSVVGALAVLDHVLDSSAEVQTPPRSLEHELAAKDAEIAALKEQLDEWDTRNAELSDRVTSNEAAISELTIANKALSDKNDIKVPLGSATVSLRRLQAYRDMAVAVDRLLREPWTKEFEPNTAVGKLRKSWDELLTSDPFRAPR